MKKNIFLYIFILVLFVSCAKNPNQEEGKKADSTSVTGSLSPSLNLVDNASGVSLKQAIIIKFSVGIQKVGKIQISQDNVTDFVSLREGSRTGAKVTFAAEINEEQKQISITPHSLKNSTRYYFNIDGSQLRGKNGEQVSSKEIQFTTIKATVPIQCSNNPKTSNQGENEMNAKLKTMIVASAIVASACEPNSQDDKKPEPTPQPPVVQNLNITDSLYKDQWHLKNKVYRSASLEDGGKTKIDINIEPVWRQDYLGEGVKIGVLDSYIQYDHPDLRDNLPAQNYFNPYPNDPFCQGADGDTHGTQVAGIIAARDNNIGTRGVAPRATLYGYTVMRSHLASAPLDKKHHLREMLKAFRRSEHRDIAVYNGSLGDGGGVESSFMTSATEQKVLRAFDQVTENGLGSKGASLVFSAGNGANAGGAAANNQFLNHYAVIAVNSIYAGGQFIATKGTQFRLGPSSINGSTGANIWLVAPAGTGLGSGSIMTTLVSNCRQENWKASFAATSSAAPSVSGVIALLRQAYPELTWRDVKLILAESAKKIAVNSATDYAWQTTGKMYSNPTKNQFYQRVLGFGLVDTGSAFQIAKTWTPLPMMKTESFTNSTALDTQTADVLHSSDLQVQGSAIRFIESVVVDLEIARTTELALYNWTLSLVSPDGKVGWVYQDLNNPDEAMVLGDNITQLRFSINAFLGNDVINGTWKLRLQTKAIGSINAFQNEGQIQEIKNWKLTVRGH